MNRFGKYIFVLLVAAAFTECLCAEQIRVVAQLDTERGDIYIGDTFTYNIVVDGDDKPGVVDVAPLAAFSPQSSGGGPVSQTSISIIRGKTTTTQLKRYVMSYLLTAYKAGQLVVPSVTVTVNNEIYQTNTVTVNILKPGTTDRINLEIALSESSCYVGQPVVMTVNFYFSTKIGRFQFDVPVFSNDAFWIEDPDFIDPGARQYRLSDSKPDMVYVTQSKVDYEGVTSLLLSFSKILIPRRAGRIQIKPAKVSVELPVGRGRSRSFFFGDYDTKYQRFIAGSRPVELSVRPLPKEGQPDGFYGLVGDYKVAASAAPTKVNVGDPITLTIKIGGKHLSPVRWPELEKKSELAKNFKIPSQKAQPVLEDGWKIFTLTIRANNDKVTDIPPIELAVFEPEQGRYLVAKTEPIKLDVAPTKVLTAADLQGGDFRPVSKEIEAIKQGLSANYEGPDVLVDMSFSPLAAALNPGYAMIWVLPLAVFVGSCLTKLLTHSSPERIAARRRRRACRTAVGRIKTLAEIEPEQTHEMLASIMKRYLGERFDKTAGSLTPDDCYVIILDATDSAELAENYKRAIADCEAGRFAPVKVDIDEEKLEAVEELIRAVDKRCKQ